MSAYESPFRFKLEQDQAVVGPAFSWVFRILGTAMVIACGWWMARLWPKQSFSFDQWVASGMFWSVAAMAILVYTLWFIWTSQSRLDSEALSQTWMWQKSIPLAHLSYAKVIRVPGLDWLFAPRIYCRNHTGKHVVIYIADKQLITQCMRLERELAAIQKF